MDDWLTPLNKVAMRRYGTPYLMLPREKQFDVDEEVRRDADGESD